MSDYDFSSGDSEEFEEENTCENHLQEHLMWLKQIRSSNVDLPETIKLIECENGTKVYLCGTAHFSEESVNDVRKLMEQTNPDFVVVELCSKRSQSLAMSEEMIMKEFKNLKFFDVIKNRGLNSGLFYYLMLRLSAYLVSELGIAPGGEFRAAVNEARKQFHCHICLGDRPINITMSRVLNSLGPWTKLKLFFSIFYCFQPITKEQIEEMKSSDMLQQLLLEMSGSHPQVTQILLDERDRYLTRSIWEVTGMKEYLDFQTKSILSDNESDQVVRKRTDSNNTHLVNSDTSQLSVTCCSNWPSSTDFPRVVVAVVGIGHVPGIQKYWSSAHSIEKNELLEIFEPPLSWKIFKWILRGTFLFTFLGASYYLLYGMYSAGCVLYGHIFYK